MDKQARTDDTVLVKSREMQVGLKHHRGGWFGGRRVKKIDKRHWPRWRIRQKGTMYTHKYGQSILEMSTRRVEEGILCGKYTNPNDQVFPQSANWDGERYSQLISVA
jgi:hypothetical protein